MLRADGEADGIRLDTLIEQLLRGELGVRCGCRVYDEGFYVGNIGKQREFYA